MAPDAALPREAPPAPPGDALPPALADAADVALVAEATRAAADVALSHFGRAPRTWTKEDASPVTEADLAVDRFLRERLTGARPGYGWLSEETADDPARLGRSDVFVVDPIDGTKAFIAGHDAWTISVAIVTDGRPRVGCLVRPVTGETFLAHAGRGAFLGRRALGARPRAGLAGARVSGPKSLLRTAAGEEGFSLVPYVHSLALRIALVAAGEIDAVVTKGGSSDWDLAAADLLVQEAGGEMTAGPGRPVYNTPEPRHGGVVAAAPGLADAVRALVARNG